MKEYGLSKKEDQPTKQPTKGKLSPEKKALALKKLQNGESAYTVAKDMGLNYKTIWAIANSLKVNKSDPPKKQPTAPEKAKEITDSNEFLISLPNPDETDHTLVLKKITDDLKMKQLLAIIKKQAIQIAFLKNQQLNNTGV